MEPIRESGEPQLEISSESARAREGDRQVLGRLLAGYRGFLLAVANRELNEELQAKLGPSDIVQETFLQAQRAFADFQGSSPAALKAWLQQILVNRCRDLRDAYLRSSKRQVSREQGAGAGDDAGELVRLLQADTGTPSEHAVENETAARVMAAMARLPVDYHEVIWMRNWESLNFEEIGQRLDRSADAARKLFLRAVQRLGDELGSADGEPTSE